MWRKAGSLLLSFWVAACSSIGPATVSRDRVDYVNAIGTSWERETLLNIVKLSFVTAMLPFFSRSHRLSRDTNSKARSQAASPPRTSPLSKTSLVLQTSRRRRASIRTAQP